MIDELTRRYVKPWNKNIVLLTEKQKSVNWGNVKRGSANKDSGAVRTLPNRHEVNKNNTN
jgi:hypothetical protein